MTEPILTWLPQLELSDPAVAALMVKPHVAGYLAQFIGAESTVQQAAQRTGTRLNVMAYWAGRFLALNLIRVTRTERRSGSAVRHYRSVADEFVLSTELLQGMSASEVLQRIMARDYNRFSRSVSRAGLRLTPDWQLRLFRDAGGYGLTLEPVPSADFRALLPRPLHDWADVPLTAETAAAFQQELGELFERFKRSAVRGPGTRRYQMHAGFVEQAE
ncbi:hypothetical protein [Deinococcus sp.]|uniref:hypothetical protein n=1 Tax=Deinococcus sp. TaxID=47478 RepID=UPI0025FE481B|nr:hypothetical protein [Deinococcus sp.]